MKTRRIVLRQQAGLTIIELMIGLALALVLAGAAAAIAVKSKGVFRVNAAVAQLQDNGRYAVDLLSRDIRMAGFRGCAGSRVAPSNRLATPTAFAYDYVNPMAGFKAAGTNIWQPALDAALSALTPAPASGSDVLTLRTTEGGGRGLVSLMTNGTQAIPLDAASPFRQADILLVSSCTSSVVVQASGNPVGGALPHAVGSVTPGNATSDLGTAFGPDANVYRLTTRSYYVAPSVIQPGTSSLWMVSMPDYQGAGAPVELAIGVEGLRIMFGEDTDNDGAANRYVAPVSANPANVVSVRFDLLLATPRDNVVTKIQPVTFDGNVITPTDRRLRTVVSSVVSVRNRIS